MRYVDEEKRPEVFTVRNCVAAVVVHLVLFVSLWLFGQLDFSDGKIVIPIELTVALDGDDGKIEPVEEPEPPKRPESRPKPKPQPDPPRQVAPPPRPQDAVVQVKDEKKPRRQKDEPKKPPEKPKEKPRKTAEELRAERIAKMRDSAKDVVVKPRPGPPSKEKRPKDWEKLLNQGYKPGERTQIAPNEESRCLGVLTAAINSKWKELSPQTGADGVALISIRFSRGGEIVQCRLAQGTGDRLSDAAALKVVGSLGTVRGLSTEFLEKYSREPITIRYKIESAR